jgi:hypothetical protein
VSERQAQALAELRCRREQDEQRDRDQVVAEFGGNPQAMADEILRYRNGLSLLAKGIDWMKLGAPFAMLPPGPLWKPKPEQVDDHHGH